MPTPVEITLEKYSPDDLDTHEGHIAVFVASDGRMDAGARRVNALTKKAIARLAESERFEKAKIGEVITLSFPAGLAAEAVHVVKLDRRTEATEVRKAGSELGRQLSDDGMLIVSPTLAKPVDLALGVMLRAYDFEPHKTGEPTTRGKVRIMVNKAEEATAALASAHAVAEGVFLARDLVNEPANVLTTQAFADRILALTDLGVEVDILEEPDLAKLGMGALLSVGQGSASPSKVAVMRWNGGGDEAPLALVGKGVVFDTGGISLKPAAGMQEMTMDMGGAGVVVGVMHTLARRRAGANVAGLVGLVENMPSGTATRPGDVVRSMKGDTIEVVNTDAEGRLVLADVLWYAQKRFHPRAIIDLATLTGAVITALGHEMTGVFTNDDGFQDRLLRAVHAEGEKAWAMPMDTAYDELIKSRIADVKNSGGRPAGSVTAARFLARFVEPDMPWCHLDIAGTALRNSATPFAPKGATGWGVMALNRLVADHFEG